MKLVLPDTKYKDSFFSFLEENDNDPEARRIHFEDDPKEIRRNFEIYVMKENERAKGKYLPKGYVPSTTYWLIDNDEFIGRVNIRHRLTDHLLRVGGHIGYFIRPTMRRKGYGKKILEMAIPKAKDLGIDKILVTCDEDNLGSKKIIEENGGVYENKVVNEIGGPLKLRYWIKLA